jgi:hypothetical protein
MLNKDVVKLQEAYSKVCKEGYVPDNDATGLLFLGGALIAYVSDVVWPAVKEFCKPEEEKYVEKALKSEKVLLAAKQFVRFPDVKNKQNLEDTLRTMDGLRNDALDGHAERQHKQDLIFKIINKLRTADL